MKEFSQYIISVLAVCITCGIFRRLVGEKGTSAAIIHTLCGVILAIAIISPVIKFNIQDFNGYINGIYTDADISIQTSVNTSNEKFREIISEKLSAYILEEANLYDCKISTVDVSLSDGQIPTPKAIQITGRFSPFARNKLSDIIESNLGIPKEDQQWNYQN